MDTIKGRYSISQNLPHQRQKVQIYQYSLMKILLINHQKKKKKDQQAQVDSKGNTTASPKSDYFNATQVVLQIKKMKENLEAIFNE